MRKIKPARAACTGITFALLLGTLPAIGTADYLSELEAEASKEAPNAAAPAGGRALGSPVPAQQRSAFELGLKSDYPHVYTFYGRLTEANKRKVLNGHLQDHLKPSQANKLIFDLYFSQNQK